MKKILITAFSLVAILPLIPAESAHATVGGPTLVSELKFDPETRSVSYVEQSYSGKGCPPELKAISVDTGETRTIYSCDDDEYVMSGNQRERIYSRTAYFPTLSQVHLRKNNVHVTVEAGEIEKLEDWIIKTDLTVRIFQGNVEKAVIPLSGCSSEQPIVIEGYRIPGAPDKILFLLSGKGDCFEGGYIRESVRLISGFDITDESQISAYKGDDPLVPHTGSLVVYAESESQAPQAPIESKREYPFVTLVMSAILFLVLGVLLGRSSKNA